MATRLSSLAFDNCQNFSTSRGTIAEENNNICTLNEIDAETQDPDAPEDEEASKILLSLLK
jgi:hypothetical protein